jgi:RNA polymerase sigma-70 factor (ECF subfamily)
VERGDTELVRAAQGGDTEALEELLRRHQDRVHALCRRVTGDDDSGLDATQEALIAIVRGIDRFDGRSSFSTWVYRVATNAALDEVRRRRRRPALLFDDALPEVVNRAEDLAVALAERLDADRALQSLSDDQRAAVVLRDLLDLDYITIAEVLRVPIGTVKSRVARGRAALADIIRAQDPTAGNPAATQDRPNAI